MRRPRILLTGAAGQVGYELAGLLPAHGDVVATDRAALDLARPDAIVAAMREVRPDLVSTPARTPPSMRRNAIARPRLPSTRAHRKSWPTKSSAAAPC